MGTFPKRSPSGMASSEFNALGALGQKGDDAKKVTVMTKMDLFRHEVISKFRVSISNFGFASAARYPKAGARIGNVTNMGLDDIRLRAKNTSARQ